MTAIVPIEVIVLQRIAKPTRQIAPAPSNVHAARKLGGYRSLPSQRWETNHAKVAAMAKARLELITVSEAPACVGDFHCDAVPAMPAAIAPSTHVVQRSNRQKDQRCLLDLCGG